MSREQQAEIERLRAIVDVFPFQMVLNACEQIEYTEARADSDKRSAESMDISELETCLSALYDCREAALEAAKER